MVSENSFLKIKNNEPWWTYAFLWNDLESKHFDMVFINRTIGLSHISVQRDQTRCVYREGQHTNLCQTISRYLKSHASLGDFYLKTERQIKVKRSAVEQRKRNPYWGSKRNEILNQFCWLIRAYSTLPSGAKRLVIPGIRRFTCVLKDREYRREFRRGWNARNSCTVL